MDSIKYEEKLADLLKQEEMYLATAESCTGGLIASRITDIPGSSAFFIGSMVTYSNTAKMKWLGVKEKTLIDSGAVSEETVAEMADGLAQRLGTICDRTRLLTIAVSGIAGPDGGTALKPVGLVWIGWRFNLEVRTASFQFQGDRLSIKNQSADQALLGAYTWIIEYFA